MDREFHWGGATYLVRRTIGGVIIYRDKAHIGGSCWAVASKSLNNTSLRLAFRNRLADAVESLDRESALPA